MRSFGTSVASQASPVPIEQLCMSWQRLGVTKLNAKGSKILYATLLPGSKIFCWPACMGLFEERDHAYALKVNPYKTLDHAIRGARDECGAGGVGVRHDAHHQPDGIS